MGNDSTRQVKTEMNVEKTFGFRCQACKEKVKVSSAYLLRSICDTCLTSYSLIGASLTPEDPNSHAGIPEGWSYLYEILNETNGKTYYGKHRPRSRESFRHYMGGGVALRKAKLKYGVENFSKTVLVFLENEMDAAVAEAQLIFEMKTIGKAEYNIAPGGAGGYSPGNGLSAHQASEITKGLWSNGDYRSRVVQGIRRALATPEARSKRSAIASSLWREPEYREKIIRRGPDHYLYGKPLSDDRVEIIKKGLERFYSELTDERREELAEARRPSAVKNFQRATHVNVHVKTEKPNRLCRYCEEDGLTVRPTKEELEEIMKKARSYSHMGELLGTKSPRELCIEYGIPHPKHFRKRPNASSS